MFNNNLGSCEWDLLRKPLSILIFTEIYINWDSNYTLPLYFYSFFGGGGGGGGFYFFIPGFGAYMTGQYKAGQSSVKERCTK